MFCHVHPNRWYSKILFSINYFRKMLVHHTFTQNMNCKLRYEISVTTGNVTYVYYLLHHVKSGLHHSIKWKCTVLGDPQSSCKTGTLQYSPMFPGVKSVKHDMDYKSSQFTSYQTDISQTLSCNKIIPPL